METKPERCLGKRILLVDDERAIRDSIRQLLHQDEHTVVEANNGAEALRLFTQEHFDVVLTDCFMPFVKGVELAASIRRLSPEQPILMITGYGVKSGPHNPVDMVLRKPFGIGELRSALAEVLGNSKEVLGNSN